MARSAKKVQVIDSLNKRRMVLEQVLISRKRLVVRLENGDTLELPFLERNEWGLPMYTNGDFHSTGCKYVPQGCYIVENSQDYINAMRAAA